ncbi:hypothetical protein evm_013523 [Chilo suppressalis]|nr:hypothetical protein evm_013523 [Chilo suppressalis]
MLKVAYFKCSDYTCVPESLVCDGYNDCADEDDEQPHLCRGRGPAECSQQLCPDGRCVPVSASCTDGLGRGPAECSQQLCPDGRCVPVSASCTDEKNECDWRACPQLCLPKHGNHTCKCVEGYRQRQLPDGGLACEFIGEKPRLVVAGEGWLRVRELHKCERELHADQLQAANER